MSIAQEVMNSIDKVGFNLDIAQKICLSNYGFMMYHYESVEGVPPDSKYVWKIFVFGDQSVVYLSKDGLAIFDKDRPPPRHEPVTNGPILVSKLG